MFRFGTTGSVRRGGDLRVFDEGRLRRTPLQADINDIRKPFNTFSVAGSVGQCCSAVFDDDHGYNTEDRVRERTRERMDQHDVERIIRSVLSDLAAPFRLLDVERTPTGWHAMLKQTMGGRVISVRMPDGPPTAIRTAVMHAIEAETEFDA